MQISELIQNMLKRYRPGDAMPPVAAIDGNIIYLEDTTRQSYLGACWFGPPLLGADTATVNQLRSALSSSFPDETFVQIELMGVPDVSDSIAQYRDPKIHGIETNDMLDEQRKRMLKASVERRADFLESAVYEAPIPSCGVKLLRYMTVISIKSPADTKPSDKQIKLFADMVDAFEHNLRALHLYLTRAHYTEYLALLRLMFNPWEGWNTQYEDDRELRQQLLEPGFAIDASDSKVLKLGNTGARMLSVKKMPKVASLALMNYFIGDPGGMVNQISTPFRITLSMRYPEPAGKKQALRNRHTILTQQAYGPMLKWSPRLAFKKGGYDILMNELESGGVPVEMCLTMTLYSSDEVELRRQAAVTSNYLSGFGMDMVEDSEILWPLFWNNLPLYPSPTSIKNLFRYRSMSVRQAIQFAPVIGEWRGTYDTVSNPPQPAAMLLFTRRGQPFTYDFYHSNSSYNGILAAESGAGKSFAMQRIVSDYLAQGAKVWIVDVGQSYYKLAKSLGGETIEFTEDSDICLNPFSNIIDFADEVAFLTALLSKMAAPEDILDQFNMAVLEEAITSVWGRKGKSMTVTDVYDWLGAQTDQRLVDLARQLFPFSRHGQYGQWFDGPNNLNFKSHLVLLELQDLKNRPPLQKVVLLQLMQRIQYEMHKTSNKLKKIAIFDEAWGLFDDPGVAKALETGWRTFRKHEGAGLAITQSLLDLEQNNGLKAIKGNSPNILVMMQNGSSVDALRDGKVLPLDNYAFEQMKTVHTQAGKYSEIMFVRGQAWGVARLVEDRFNQVLFSTKGEERSSVLEALEEGRDVVQVIEQFIAERG